MRILNRKILTLTIFALAGLTFTACPGKGVGPDADGGDKQAATVNGTPIMLEEVERAVKANAQGEEATLSQMELAQARLQILQQLIQQEVMFQKAEKEQTVPSDQDVVAELNKLKTQSGVSKEDFEKRLKETGQTEATLKDSLKKDIATRRLVEKITGKIEPPSDSEITGFYDGNKDYFVKKRGVELATIVVDPRDSGQGDVTRNEAEASQRIKEIGQQLQNSDFATVARAFSEDQTAIRGGDLGNVSEEEMKSRFSPQFAAQFMSQDTKIGSLAGPFQIAGKYYIFKLKNRFEKDEDLTLESPGVKQQITDTLVNSRKQLLAASYQAIAMNEAKVVNFLAQQVVDNPNELSGARPVKAAEKTDGDGGNTNTSANQPSNASNGSNITDVASENTSGDNGNTAETEKKKGDSESSANGSDSGEKK